MVRLSRRLGLQILWLGTHLALPDFKTEMADNSRSTGNRQQAKKNYNNNN